MENTEHPLMLPNVIFMNFFKRVDDALRFKAKCKLRRMKEKEKKDVGVKDSGSHPLVEIEFEFGYLAKIEDEGERRARGIL